MNKCIKEITVCCVRPLRFGGLFGTALHFGLIILIDTWIVTRASCPDPAARWQATVEISLLFFGACKFHMNQHCNMATKKRTRSQAVWIAGEVTDDLKQSEKSEFRGITEVRAVNSVAPAKSNWLLWHHRRDPWRLYLWLGSEGEKTVSSHGYCSRWEKKWVFWWKTWLWNEQEAGHAS